MLDMDSYRQALLILEKYADGETIVSNACKFGLRDMNGPVCSAGQDTLNINPFGDLDPKCADCAYSGARVVCLGAAYKENNGEFKPCVYTCGMARTRCELAENLLEISGQ